MSTASALNSAEYRGRLEDGGTSLDDTGSSYRRCPPNGGRLIIRRERPHPGAQLDLIEQRDGYRYTGLATDTRAGQHSWLDARHRAHARVEDRIRTGRDTGLGRLPSRAFAINAA
jgi:hypothetical protein